MRWIVDRISKGTDDGAPTGDSSNNKHVLQLEAENNADSAAQNAKIHSLKVYVEQ